MPDLVFTVRDSGLDPAKKAEIIKLINQRVDEAISELWYNVPFLFDISEITESSKKRG